VENTLRSMTSVRKATAGLCTLARTTQRLVMDLSVFSTYTPLFLLDGPTCSILGMIALSLGCLLITSCHPCTWVDWLGVQLSS
jgi:hypothetical protein